MPEARAELLGWEKPWGFQVCATPCVPHGHALPRWHLLALQTQPETLSSACPVPCALPTVLHEGRGLAVLQVLCLWNIDHTVTLGRGEVCYAPTLTACLPSIYQFLTFCLGTLRIPPHIHGNQHKGEARSLFWSFSAVGHVLCPFCSGSFPPRPPDKPPLQGGHPSSWQHEAGLSPQPSASLLHQVLIIREPCTTLRHKELL